MKEYFLKNINTFLLLIIGGLLVLNMLKTKEVKTDVKGYQEKINDVDNFGVNELELFFTNRYK